MRDSSETVSYKRDERLEVVHMRNCPREYKKHSHASIYVVGIILDGSIALIRESRQHLVARDWFVVPPYQAHALILQGAYELLTICIQVSCIQNKSLVEITDLLEGALSSQNIKDTRLTGDIARHLLAINPKRPSKSEIGKSVLLVKDHPEANLPLQTLARQSYVSKSKLIQAFKDETGVTPHKFQLQRRIRCAQRALEDGSDVASLAAELGFHDQSHLHKCFKSMVGMTPIEYQESVSVISSY